MSDIVRDLMSAAVDAWHQDYEMCPHTEAGRRRRMECEDCLVDGILDALDDHCWPIEPKAAIK